MPNDTFVGWAFYRKKPVIIKAVQFTGRNGLVIREWAKGSIPPDEMHPGDKYILISTPEGVMVANIGDWIIEGIKGEFYPCKPDIFAAIYEDAVVEGNTRP
jgi:hypothetical protein